ncbi:exodeoxyribonuclease VII large subunit [Oligella ureolytica]
MSKLLSDSQARFVDASPRLNRQMEAERLLLDKSMRFDELKPRLVAPQRLLNQYEERRLQLQQMLDRNWQEQYIDKVTQLERLTLRLEAKKPNIVMEHERLSQWQERLNRAIKQQLSAHQQVYLQYQQVLHNINPKQVLQRGFSIVYDADGRVVQAAEQLNVGQELQLEFREWSCQTIVKSL